LKRAGTWPARLWGGLWLRDKDSSNGAFREKTSKRCRGFPSETKVKRGKRIVHGDKELIEKLGRNDPCPCGSGRRFQEMLHAQRALRWLTTGLLLLGSEPKTLKSDKINSAVNAGGTTSELTNICSLQVQILSVS